MLTGNIRPLAEVKLRLAGLGDTSTWTSAPTATCTRSGPNWWRWPGARPAQAYGTDFSGSSTVLVGDTPLDVEAALAAGARAVAVATGSYTAADLAAAARTWCCPT